MLTKRGADAVATAPKEIRESISWLAIPGKETLIYRLRAKVLCPSFNVELDLRGFVGKRNYGFTLLYGTYPIREYHYHARHHNPGRKMITGHHKHYWDDNFGRQMAYVPADIKPAGNIDDDFRAFLKECNIALSGEYERLPGSV
jgi:hypothetical protein